MSVKLICHMGIIVASLLTLGCAGQNEVRSERRFPIEVKKAPILLELSKNDKLTDLDRRKIINFTSQWHNSHKSPINMAWPKIFDNAKLQKQVFDLLVELNIPEEQIKRGTYKIGEQGATGIVLFYDRKQAVPVSCKTLWEEPAFTPRNDVSESYGCAAQHNLSIMVANPNDLVEPRPTTMIDHEGREIALEAYRNNSGKTLASEETK